MPVREKQPRRAGSWPARPVLWSRPGSHSRRKPGLLRRQPWKTPVRQTPRWRKQDSTPRSPPKAVSLAPVLAEPDADPVAVAPDGIEQQREVTTKEGMLDETILIMVVDKSATITVNSQVRLGSLSS